MSTLREICHCGHHKATHFKESGACLGVHCDDCKVYRDEAFPDMNKVPRRPEHRTDCECFDCKAYKQWVKKNWGA